MGGWPGLDFQTWDYAYDVEPTIMTHSATRAISEVSPSPSLYRAEQYDSDLGLYYLRARYYNPLTGRFLSRDPEDGQAKDSASLHKYLYADGDPINGIDPMGREDLITNLVQIAKVIVKVEAARNFAIFCTVATLTVEAALFEYLSDEHLSVLDKAAVFGAVGGCVAVLPAFLAVAGW